MFSVKSSSLLKSLSITVDWTLEYTKPYNKNQTEDLSSADLDLSGYEPGSHTITVQAMDANWKMNSASITDVLESADSEPPFFVAAQSKKEVNDDWSYQITAIFDDHLSWIPWWTIKVNWDTVTTFNWRLASFNISSDIESFEAEVKDNYGNVLNQTISIYDF